MITLAICQFTSVCMNENLKRRSCHRIGKAEYLNTFPFGFLPPMHSQNMCNGLQEPCSTAQS